MGMYRPCGGCSYNGFDGNTWKQFWISYNKALPELTTIHKDYPDDLPSLAPRALLEAKYQVQEI